MDTIDSMHSVERQLILDTMETVDTIDAIECMGTTDSMNKLKKLQLEIFFVIITITQKR